LIAPEQNLRDFDVIWLDDNLDKIVVKKIVASDVDERLIRLIAQVIEEAGGSISSRQIGRILQLSSLENPNSGVRDNALNLLRTCYNNLSHFLQIHADKFSTQSNLDSIDFAVSLKKERKALVPSTSDASSGLVFSSSDNMVMSLSRGDLGAVLDDEIGVNMLVESEEDMIKRALDAEEVEDDVAHYKRFGMDSISLSSKTDRVTDGADEPDDGDAETSSALNIVRFVLMNSPDGELSSREIGRALQATEISLNDGEDNNEVSNLLAFVKSKYGNLRAFLGEFKEEFNLTFYSSDVLTKQGRRAGEYMVSLAATDDAEDDFVETVIVKKEDKAFDVEDLIEIIPVEVTEEAADVVTEVAAVEVVKEVVEEIVEEVVEEVVAVVAEKTRRKKAQPVAEEGEKPKKRASRSKKAA
jgi:hypothetical protein